MSLNEIMSLPDHCVRSLIFLGYPHFDSIDLNCKESFVQLVCWLEEMKIRAYEIECRLKLRCSDDIWNNSFNEYLEFLNSPWQYGIDETVDCISWLISHAISIEYEDLSDDCRNIEMTEPGIVIEELGHLIGLDRLSEENISVYFKRILSKIKLNYSSGALEANMKYDINTSDTDINTATAFSIQDFPLDFSTGDPIVDRLAIILKMLHLGGLRDLQNEVNDIITIGQEYSANPKTNTALGKVGR